MDCVIRRVSRFLVVLMLVPLLVLVGCKSENTNGAAADSGPVAADNAGFDATCPTENTIAFAKTKFVLHAGLGFGAFHRWLWRPYREGRFASGADGRVMAFVKGGLAALFVKREVRLALEDVKANPTLCRTLAAPLAKIGNTVTGAFDRLKQGDASGITDLNSAISNVERDSAAGGATIKEDENADIGRMPR